MNNQNTVSFYSQKGLTGIPKADAEAEIKKHPEIIKHCHDNFWKYACPDDCPYYKKCFSLNFKDDRGVFPIYPMNYYNTQGEKS
jgi:hypothetical protein